MRSEIYLVSVHSVTALESRQYAIGEQIEMTLMKKLRGSTRVMPASEWSAFGSFPSKFSGMYQVRVRNVRCAVMLIME
jgi:hypothetical protein